MSGGVGEVTGAIPLPRPDRAITTMLSNGKYQNILILGYYCVLPCSHLIEA